MCMHGTACSHLYHTPHSYISTLSQFRTAHTLFPALDIADIAHIAIHRAYTTTKQSDPLNCMQESQPFAEHKQFYAHCSGTWNNCSAFRSTQKVVKIYSAFKKVLPTAPMRPCRGAALALGPFRLRERSSRALCAAGSAYGSTLTTCSNADDMLKAACAHQVPLANARHMRQ